MFNEWQGEDHLDVHSDAHHPELEYLGEVRRASTAQQSLLDFQAIWQLQSSGRFGGVHYLCWGSALTKYVCTGKHAHALHALCMISCGGCSQGRDRRMIIPDYVLLRVLIMS